MGVPTFALASAVNLIMAQRLTRRLCPRCKIPVTVTTDIAKVGPNVVHKNSLISDGFSEDVVNEFMSKDEQARKLYANNPQGCDHCSSGYKGRVGIYQVMPISEEMKRLIMTGRNALELAEQARREGIPDLRQSGLKKVADGLTSMTELNRVTQE